MPHPQSPFVQGSRSFMKCFQCRDEHKKCLPADRDWDGKGEKCERCSRLGNSCGPPQRKPKPVLIDRDIPAVNIQPVQRQIPHFDAFTMKMVNTSTSPSRSTEMQSTPEGSVCSSNLAIIIVIHELLLSLLFSLGGRRQAPLLETMNINVDSKTIRDMIRRLDHVFTNTTQSMHTTPASAGSLDRLPDWKMPYFCERHFNLRNIQSLSQAQAYVAARDQWAAYMPYDTDTRFLACTERVFHDAATEPSKRLEPSHLCKEDYVELETRIKNLLPDIQVSGSAYVTPGVSARLGRRNAQGPNLFSASRIACLNQDTEIASQLCNRPSDHFPDIDLTGRSFMHITAAHQGVQSCPQITTHAPEAVNYTNRNQAGCYTIDLTSGSDNNRQTQAFSRNARARLVSDTRRMNSRFVSSNLAQIAKAHNFPRFSSSISNKSLLPGTPEETERDLEGMDLCSGSIQMVDGLDMCTPQDLDQHSATFQHSTYHDNAVRGFGYPNQFPQLMNHQVLYPCLNPLCTMLAPHPGPCQPYNPPYDPPYNSPRNPD